MRHLSRLLLLFCSSPLLAGIATDGSLGPALQLPGPVYKIPAYLGSRSGDNLFHSFGEFSLQRGEIATFSGPPGIRNLVARVTGGEVSEINGKLSSELAQASIYLLNPAGFLFGPQASLDTQGSLHFSSANFIEFADRQRFFADRGQASTLSFDTPVGFGFDSGQKARITIEQTQLLVPDATTLSFSAAHLQVRQTELAARADNGSDSHVLLLANGDQANLLTLDGDAERPPSGAISLTASRFRLAGGSLSVRAGQVDLVDSSLSTEIDNFYFGHSAGGIDIQANTELQLSGNSRIATSAMDNAGFTGQQAGTIYLSGDSIRLRDNCQIVTSTLGRINAGAIRLVGQRLELHDRALIQAAANADPLAGEQGNGGAIEIAGQQIQLTNLAAIRSETHSAGHAGRIDISSRSLSLQGGATIATSSSPGARGRGGPLALTSDHLSLTGTGTLITSASFGSGDSGAIVIQGRQLQIADGAEIRALSRGLGDAGAIRIELSGNLSVSEAAISTEAEQGRGGTINLLSDKLLLRQGQITTSVTDPLGLDAGDIAVTADTLVMVGGFIQANALAANTRGGDILIDNRQLLSGYGLLQLGGQERQVFSPQARLNVIQAVSPDGIDGEIRVAEPDTDLTSVLSVLSKDYHQLRQLDADPCQVDDFRQVSSLILQGRGALPAGGLTP